VAPGHREGPLADVLGLRRNSITDQQAWNQPITQLPARSQSPDGLVPSSNEGYARGKCSSSLATSDALNRWTASSAEFQREADASNEPTPGLYP